MNSFSYYAPTKILFGLGSVNQIGKEAKAFGRKALLVHGSNKSSHSSIYENIKKVLVDSGIEVSDFDGVLPNPTTEVVTAGALIAKENKADMVIGIGGGSAMDTAKAIAVESTHRGTAFDYLFYTDGPTCKTLPIIAVGTTAGTGSQVTPCSVITNTKDKNKSAIWNANIFPKVAIVDPVLTASMPVNVTAQTGFDAFCHNFEAYISRNTNPLVEAMAIDAIKIIAKQLPIVIRDGQNMEARSQMAWADTLGGLTNASGGVTLPHGLGMQVGGHCPNVTHGQSLAIIYPQFMRFTWKASIQKFATVGRIFNPKLCQEPDEVAAEMSCIAIDDFLKEIGLWIGFKDLGVSNDEIYEIAECGHVLNDYKNNPRVATIEEMHELLKACYERTE
ncbi:MAG: iron-containing alcohol dehydrogenase [Lachnospiraceae bacterium]|nr:iron-containing alcohol dehydrogenase [Lachnospiraceae bacterium]